VRLTGENSVGGAGAETAAMIVSDFAVPMDKCSKIKNRDRDKARKEGVFTYLFFSVRDGGNRDRDTMASCETNLSTIGAGSMDEFCHCDSSTAIVHSHDRDIKIISFGFHIVFLRK
jgi:hypothetical protein